MFCGVRVSPSEAFRCSRERPLAGVRKPMKDTAGAMVLNLPGFGPASCGPGPACHPKITFGLCSGGRSMAGRLSPLSPASFFGPNNCCLIGFCNGMASPGCLSYPRGRVVSIIFRCSVGIGSISKGSGIGFMGLGRMGM